MTEAEILSDYRATIADYRAAFGDGPGFGKHHDHLADCAELRVTWSKATMSGRYTSELRCPHSGPIGFTRLDKGAS